MKKPLSHQVQAGAPWAEPGMLGDDNIEEGSPGHCSISQAVLYLSLILFREMTFNRRYEH
ncbi:hypothetical protein HMPREF0880_02240 [Yokenella regensburgei ATCC 43003]|nr:hypothetical protein HMPREF0880_02240 [Yokenella regensburgei ATCC 43003]